MPIRTCTVCVSPGQVNVLSLCQECVYVPFSISRYCWHYALLQRKKNGGRVANAASLFLSLPPLYFSSPLPLPLPLHVAFYSPAHIRGYVQWSLHSWGCEGVRFHLNGENKCACNQPKLPHPVTTPAIMCIFTPSVKIKNCDFFFSLTADVHGAHK